jgi:hypothetical protein
VQLPTSSEHSWPDGVSRQVNLPFSKQIAGVYFHANAGGTFESDGNTPFLAGSAIVAVVPMFNLMFEALVQSAPGDGDEREVVRIFRRVFAWAGISATRNLSRASPSHHARRRARHRVLGYLSYELPFRK